MGIAYEKRPEGFMTIQEVEEFLGIGYQSFKDELTPTNFDYSTNESGCPKNLYRISDVEAYDDLYHYSMNKDRYNTNQVAKILHRSAAWVLQEIKPTDQIIRNGRIYSFYDKKLINQYLDTKNGILYPDASELQSQILILKNKIQNLETQLKNQKKRMKLGEIIQHLLESDIEIEI